MFTTVREVHASDADLLAHVLVTANNANFRGIVPHRAGLAIFNMRVEVLRCNPNRAVYEKLGAASISERPFDWDGVILPMCSYGWADTRYLLPAQGSP